MQSVCMFNEVRTPYRGLNMEYIQTPIFDRHYSKIEICEHNCLLYILSICCHLRYTATNCNKQRVALYRRLTVLTNLTIPL
jgi:hypothetical protein